MLKTALVTLMLPSTLNLYDSKLHSEELINTCTHVQGGGESLNQLNERCVSYLNKIAQEHIGNLQTSFLIICIPPNSLTGK
jgi:hypothetical protein